MNEMKLDVIVEREVKFPYSTYTFIYKNSELEITLNDRNLSGRCHHAMLSKRMKELGTHADLTGYSGKQYVFSLSGFDEDKPYYIGRSGNLTNMAVNIVRNLPILGDKGGKNRTTTEFLLTTGIKLKVIKSFNSIADADDFKEEKIQELGGSKVLTNKPTW